ncbi:hypothetical protein [Streptomyces sp. NBC_01579]
MKYRNGSNKVPVPERAGRDAAYSAFHKTAQDRARCVTAQPST